MWKSNQIFRRHRRDNLTHWLISTQVTRADDTETCFQWFWKEVQWLEDHPRHATSLLLMTNPYWASNFDAFEQFGDALTQALQSATESKVEGLGFEGQIQLVFFHPQYVFRIFACAEINQ